MNDDPKFTLVCPACDQRHEGCTISTGSFSVRSDQITKVAREPSPVNETDLVCNSCGASSTFMEWFEWSRSGSELNRILAGKTY